MRTNYQNTRNLKRSDSEQLGLVSRKTTPCEHTLQCLSVSGQTMLFAVEPLNSAMPSDGLVKD